MSEKMLGKIAEQLDYLSSSLSFIEENGITVYLSYTKWHYIDQKIIDFQLECVVCKNNDHDLSYEVSVDKCTSCDIYSQINFLNSLIKKMEEEK